MKQTLLYFLLSTNIFASDDACIYSEAGCIQVEVENATTPENVDDITIELRLLLNKMNEIIYSSGRVSRHQRVEQMRVMALTLRLLIKLELGEGVLMTDLEHLRGRDID